MINIKPDHFHKEIEYNLNILQKSVRTGLSPDLGFIGIFINDIKILEESGFNKKKVAKLSRKLELVAGKMTDKSQAVFGEGTVFKDVEVSLMGPRLGIQSVADEYVDESVVRKGLEKLATHYDTRRIRGDGHCLFRAIGADYLRALTKSDKPADMLKHIEDTIKDLGNPQSLAARFSELKKLSLKLEKMPDMNDPDYSGSIVQFLRDLAVLWMKKNKTETFEEMAIDYTGSVEKYLERMQRDELGGEAELQALSQILGMRFHVLDALRIGRGRSVNEPLSFVGDAKFKTTLNLLYRPGHYDLLIKKSEETGGKKMSVLNQRMEETLT